MEGTVNYLNLDSDFEPFGPGLVYKFLTFPGGEPDILLTSSVHYKYPVTITTRIRSFQDLGLLLVATDAVRRAGCREIHLYLPYFPGARQDRVRAPGGALTVKVYADLVNAQNYESVTILDPHSDVTPALLNRCRVRTNYHLVQQVTQRLQDYVLISPDAGAVKKIYGVSQALGNVPVVECGKKRDEMTGLLSGFTCPVVDLEQKTCIVVDDICDGGGTFLGLGKLLKERNAGTLILVVSHGIFSQGTEQLLSVFSSIHTTDSFSDNQPGVTLHRIQEYR